jgi:N-acetylneuraminic acid mutarotase
VPFAFTKLADIPDAHGFAGPYAGMSNGALIVAGGANFPGDPPWKGGTKAWYDAGYVLPKGETTWRKIDAALPSARGYGGSITTSSGLICIGGVDATRCHADVFRLEWIGGRLVKHDLPPLPMAMANFASAAIGSNIYVAGGNESPTATTASAKLLMLDLAKPNATWQTLEPCPAAGRILPVSAVVDGSFFLLSGASLAPNKDGTPARTYLTDAYCYTPGKGWQRIPDLPHAVVAAPSPAATTGAHRFAIFGGDDGSLVNFEPKDRHPGFSHDVLQYDTVTASWNTIGQLPLGQVTTSIVPFGDKFIVPNGEIRPAVRTPIVTVATPTSKVSR